MKQTKIYDNGLRLIFEKNQKSVVSVSIMFNVGSQNETKTQEGFSHFIEHMIFKGTKTMNSVDIMDKLTFLGADFNAFTSKTVTKFVFKCLAENFEKCFEIYADMLINAEFEKGELDRERQVVIEEMKRCDDDPTEVMFKRVMENYFSGLSYAHDELGNEEIIENVTRKELLDYKNKFYKAENCVISVVGNLDFDKLDKIIENNFSCHFEYKAKPNQLDFETYKINISKKYDIVKRDDNQVNACVLIKSVSSVDKDKYACSLYSSILGNSQNSRLFKIIREKLGLVYTICAYNDISCKSGELLIMFGTRPKNVKQAMIEIKKAITDFAENGASQEELDRAKNWKKSCLSYGMETNSDLAEINGTIFNVFGKIFDVNERCKQIESVTLDDVNAFAKRIANETTFNVVAVGKDITIDDINVF